MQEKIAFVFETEQLSHSFFCDELNGLFDFYKRHYSDKRCDTGSVCVAVSGGVDSVSLLVLLRHWSVQSGVKIVCVTVDHKLRKESHDEAVFVRNLCEKFGITHSILTWNRKEHFVNHGKLENAARDARYALISDFCQKESIHILLTGHTWNDQLETFVMRKDSGSLSSGLAGISRIRSLTNNLKLLRPLLHFSKKHLEDFLIRKKITWEIDPMNNMCEFKRVSCRKKIALFDDKTLRRYSGEIIEFGKMRNKLEIDAVNFLKTSCTFSKFGYAVVELIPFLSEKTSVQMEIIRRVVWNIGGKKYATSVDESIIGKIICKKNNTIGKCLLKVKKDRIFVFRENRNIKPFPAERLDSPSIWDNRFLVNFKSVLNNNSAKCECPDLPKEALWGLPCVLRNHRIWRFSDSSLNDIFFVNKVNLFDVFL
jgi:tRNA(Ile)-lysidine synthase